MCLKDLEDGEFQIHDKYAKILADQINDLLVHHNLLLLMLTFLKKIILVSNFCVQF